MFLFWDLNGKFSFMLKCELEVRSYEGGFWFGNGWYFGLILRSFDGVG